LVFRLTPVYRVIIWCRHLVRCDYGCRLWLVGLIIMVRVFYPLPHPARSGLGNQNLLAVPLTTSNLGRCAFMYSAPLIWNDLLLSVSPSFQSLQVTLKNLEV